MHQVTLIIQAFHTQQLWAPSEYSNLSFSHTLTLGEGVTMPTMSKIKFPHIEQPGLRVRVQRYFMTIFCFLYCILGIVVIACGALLLTKRQMECRFLAQYYSGVCLYLAAGCFTSFFAICGCWQTRKNNAPHYYTSLLLVLVVVIMMEIAAGVACHILYVQASDGQLLAGMEGARDNFWLSGRSAECVDKIQRQFQCCGVSNYTDWFTVWGNSSDHDVFPPSCMCKSNSSSCVQQSVLVGNQSEPVWVLQESCLGPLLSDIYDNLLVVRIASPVTVVVKVIFLLMTIFFLHHISNRSLVGAYIVTQPSVSHPAVSDGEALSGAARSDNGWLEMREREERPVKHFNSHRPHLSRTPPESSFSRGETVMHL